MKKLTALLLVLLLMLTVLTSCSAADKNTAIGGENAPSAGVPTEPEGGKAENDNSYVDTAEDYARKIIKTYNISLETKDYTTARDAILSEASAIGGYVSDSSEKDTLSYNGQKSRSATFTVRVPSASVDTYVNGLSAHSSVLSKKLSTEDITTSYYDLESQLESLLDQEARIKKLMDEATNYNYLLQLDDKLTSIRAQINNINKQIQVYDKSVALSFVYITLEEVVEYTEIKDSEPTFGERIAEAFTGTFKNFADFCQELFIAIIWMLPLIIITGIAVPTILLLVRRFDRKKREKYEAELKAKEEKK